MRSIIRELLNKTPVSFARDRLFQPVGSGETKMQEHLGAMGLQSTLFAIVDRIASSIAAATWRLYRTARSGEPEDRTLVPTHPALEVWRKPNPFYCLAPETRVVTQDLEWVSVGDLEAGDQLLGFDEDRPKGKRRRWQNARVIDTGRRMLPSYRVTLADGTQTVASAEHRWLTSSRVDGSYWRRTKDLMGHGIEDKNGRPRKPGNHHGPTRVVKLLDVWDTASDYDSGYLAGMFDGEASLHANSGNGGYDLAIAQKSNSALDAVKLALDRFGFRSKERTHYHGVHYLTLLGGGPEILRFLGMVRPKRLLDKWNRQGVRQLGCIQRLENVAVVDIEYLGEREVVALGTSTGTLVADGFAHHNTQAEFVETMQQHYELTGEWWWILSRSSLMRGNGPPIEIWPVRPDRMQPVPHPTKFISGYIYMKGRTEVPLKLDDVIFNKRPNPLDPYRGIGPVGTLLMDIEGEAAASTFNTMFFRNNAEPGGIIEVTDSLSDEEFDKLVERWQLQHQGVGRSHRVAVIEQGVWKDRRYTQRDMQFEQLRRFSRETFRQAWGFPKPLLGDVEDVNRANAEAAEVVFSRWLLVPRLNRLRTSLNDDFLPQFGSLGRGYEFDYDPVIPPNDEQIRKDLNSRTFAAMAFVDRDFDSDAVLEAFGFPLFPRVELEGPKRVVPELEEELVES